MRKDIEGVVDKYIDTFVNGIKNKNISSIPNYELAIRIREKPGTNRLNRLKDAIYDLNVKNRAGSHCVVDIAVKNDHGDTKILLNDLVFIDLYDNAVLSFCDQNKARPVFELLPQNRPVEHGCKGSYLLHATAYYFNVFEDICKVECSRQIDCEDSTITNAQRERLIVASKRELIKQALGDLLTKIANQR